MNKTPATIALMLSMFLFATAALAAPEKWDIDKAHSNIYFDVKHTYSTVRGMFDDFSGTLLMDPDHPSASSVEFTVNVASINTHIPQRDDHLRSDDFFAAEKFPKMTFKSTAVKSVSGNQFLIEGDLTIKETTQRIAVPFTYFGMQENPMKKGQMVAGFEAEFTINRLHYGVGSGKFADMGVVGRDVRIIVTLEVLNTP
jgi:polyisoprenoid-binding protein YceI